MSLSIAFALTYGEARASFFPDTMLALMCARARALGHRAELIRVYYSGDPSADADVARRFEEWLERNRADLVVVERLFDPEPVRRHLERDARRHGVLISRGDSVDVLPGIDRIVGASGGPTRNGRTRRTPTAGELLSSFEQLLDALEREPERAVPGVAQVVDGTIVHGPPSEQRALPRPFAVVLDEHVISASPPPAITRKTLFGNMGCPYAEDPTEQPFFHGVKLPMVGEVARLGCSFCAMGGDYEKRPDDQVIDELVEQATFFSEHTPEVNEFVLNDQHATRYLARLLRAARGLRPARFLFAARPDSFVRDRARVDEAIVAARETGHQVEVYLSGFEAFSDTELARYNKGCTREEQLAAIDVMRTLAREHPAQFDYKSARGHSLILWNPWTTPETLGETVDAFRRHGLRELFDELARNRLRLYPDLPIYFAAERDGALSDAWSDAGGAGRRKGYSLERPWRFLDRRTTLAHELAGSLREVLGHETELAQLAAVVAETRAPSLDPARVREDTIALRDLLETLAGARAHGAPRGRTARGEAVLFGGACNNACGACAQRDRWVDDDPRSIATRIDTARATGAPVVLAGREPTLVPRVVEWIGRAAGTPKRTVAMVTNGRRFAYPAFARALAHAGLASASVKVFGLEADAADEITRAPGSHAESLRGLLALFDAGVTTELRLMVHASSIDALHRAPELARSVSATQLRLEVTLDALGLQNLSRARVAIETLAAHSDFPLEVLPLTAGPRGLALLPEPQPR